MSHTDGVCLQHLIGTSAAGNVVIVVV